MSRYDDQILDNYGRPVPGASVYVYDDAGALAALTDDLAAPLDNPLTSDADGLFAFNATDGEKTLDVWFGGIRRWREAILVGPPDPGPVGPAGDIAKADNRAAVAAIVGQAAKATRWLAEAGREGLFVFDGSNLAAMVTADPAQGIHIAPASDPTGASGAWVRKFSGGVDINWFGAVGDNVTDDYGAVTAAIALLKAAAFNNDVYYKGSQRLYGSASEAYYCSDTIDITHTLIIEGDSSVNGYSTRFRFPVGKTGFRIQAANTSGGAVVDGALHYSGSYSIIRNVGIFGPYPDNSDFSGLVEGEFHGVHARSNVIIEDCMINGFQGDGLHATTGVGAGGANEGNSNCSFVNRLRVVSCRNGVYLDGADANAWSLIGVIGTYCRQHTVWDSSFLGNTHIGHHSANTGLVPGVASSVVSYGGNRYFVLQGQAVGASVNAPSGTAADNTWWGYLAAGAADLAFNIRAWVNGVSVREGGSYRTDSANAANTFIGCYVEGGEAPPQFVSPTVVIGGLWGSRDPVTNGNYFAGSKIVAANQARLGATIAAIPGAGQLAAAKPLVVWNNAAIAASTYASIFFGQGLEADGVTPCYLAAISGASNTANPATAEGYLYFSTRTFATGVMAERFLFDGAQSALRPATDNLCDFGLGGSRWKIVYGYTGDFTTQVKVAGTKVIGAQGAAVADPAAITSIAGVNAVAAPTKAEFDALVAVANAIRVDLASTRTQLVAALARLRAATGHGLFA